LLKISAVLLIIFCLLTSTGTAEDTAVPVTIIMFPLDGSYDDDRLSWLGKGISLSISGQLESDRVNVVNRDDRIGFLEQLDLPVNVSLSKGSLIRAAQVALADLVVMGNLEINEQRLTISLQVLTMDKINLSGEISATGPLAMLAQMENELAWMILQNNGLESSISREVFRERTRRSDLSEFADHIDSLTWRESHSTPILDLQ
jgi:hypothetical protein